MHLAPVRGLRGVKLCTKTPDVWLIEKNCPSMHHLPRVKLQSVSISLTPEPALSLRPRSACAIERRLRGWKVRNVLWSVFAVSFGGESRTMVFLLLPIFLALVPSICRAQAQTSSSSSATSPSVMMRFDLPSGAYCHQQPARFRLPNSRSFVVLTIEE